MHRSPWHAAALVLALTACTGNSQQKPVAVAEPAPPAVEVVIAPPPPTPVPVISEVESDIVIATLTPPTEPVAPPEPEIDDNPEQLMGLAGGALTALLGEPGYRRQDADAQVWQYRGIDCLLDVYLYTDGDGTPHRVTYYEFRGAASARPCLRELLL